MTPQRIRNLQRARELDDDHPDLVCPGCGGDIDGWWEWYGHGHGRPGGPVPFWGNGQALAITCPWTKDYLSARMFRRRLLREAMAQGEQLVMR